MIFLIFFVFFWLRPHSRLARLPGYQPGHPPGFSPLLAGPGCLTGSRGTSQPASRPGSRPASKPSSQSDRHHMSMMHVELLLHEHCLLSKPQRIVMCGSACVDSLRDVQTLEEKRKKDYENFRFERNELVFFIFWSHLAPHLSKMVATYKEKHHRHHRHRHRRRHGHSPLA